MIKNVLLIWIACAWVWNVLADNDIRAAISHTIHENQRALQQTPATDAASPAEISQVVLGFAGEFRLGEWAPLTFELPAEPSTPAPATLRVWGRDGDDRPVCDQGPVFQNPVWPSLWHGRFRLGRSQGELRIEVLDQQQQVVAQKTVPLVSETPELKRIWSPTAKLIGLIGITPEVRDRLTRLQRELGDGDSVVYVDLGNPGRLPADPLVYRNLDSLLISASTLAAWEKVAPEIVSAWRDWLSGGGKVCLWAGPEGLNLLQSGGLLESFCPGELQGVADLTNSAKLEFFVNAKTPLLSPANPRLSVLKLSRSATGVVLQQDDVPILVRQPVRFGLLTFLNLPLDQRPASDWPGSTILLEQLATGQKWSEERSAGEMAKGQVSHVGFRDLVGQLRSPLEQFSQVGLVNFTSVAVLITLFILLVGPIDYFLMRRWLKRPHWTWVSFPLWALLFSALAWWIADRSKPAEFQVNQLEMIDLDARSGASQGIAWSAVFSPRPQHQDVTAQLGGRLVENLDAFNIHWMGQPGSGFGAMQSPATIRIPSQPYQVVATDLSADSAAGAASQIVNFPFPVSSTVVFQSLWSGRSSPVRSRLKSGQMLTGTISNPFDFRLVNCRLFFESAAYVFDRPIDAGETVDLVEAKRRLGKSLVTRRLRTSAEQVQNVPWNPADTDFRRIAEMLTLHDLAGGQGYTNLSHRYLPQLDASAAFAEGLGQAILIAELEQPTTVLQSGEKSLADQYDRKVTLIRIFLPVELPQKNRGTSEQLPSE